MPGEEDRVQLTEAVEAGGLVFLRLETPEFGREVWVSDGTERGTRVLDLNPGAAGSASNRVRGMLGLGSEVLINAAIEGYGSGLWRSDGTLEGTKSLDTPPVLSPGEQLVVSGSRIFFGAADSSGVLKLWTSRGTPGEPPALLHQGLIDPVELTSLPGGRVFVWGGPERFEQPAWVSDGTTGGTSRLGGLGRAGGHRGVERFGDGVLLLASTEATGDALWFSDGTEAGTRLVFDPESGSERLHASSLAVAGPIAFVEFYDSQSRDYRTWRSDGTAEGTQPFTEARGPARGTGSPAGFVLYDISEYNRSERGVYLADANGVVQLFDDRIAQFQVAVGELVFFTAPDDDGTHSIWVSDGSLAGTRLLSAGRYVHAAGSRVFFTRGGELWSSDGGAPAHRVASIASNVANSEFAGFVALEGRAVFGANGELWATDGTAEGTRRILEGGGVTEMVGRVGERALYARSGSLESTDGGFAEANAQLAGWYGDDSQKPWSASIGDRVVFRGAVGLQGRFLPHATDGTASGTIVLNIEQSEWADLGGFMRRGDEVLFLSQGPSELHPDINRYQTVWQLWKSNGTPTGTQRLGQLGPEVVAGRRYGWEMPSTMLVGDQIFLVACTAATEAELFRYDFALGRPVLVADITPDYYYPGLGCSLFGEIDGDYPVPFPLLWSKVGDRLLFIADGDSGTGAEPWVSDGTREGTSRLSDILPGPASSLGLEHYHNPRLPPAVSLHDRVFFVADDGTHGRELWVSDGTPEGTRLIDIFVGRGGSNPRSLNAVDGRLYFVASDSRGDGLYTSDGTSGGTRRLDALSPGLVDVGMVAVDGRLVYPAYSSELGLELFAVDLDELAAGIPLEVESVRVKRERGGFRLRVRSRGQESLVIPAQESRGDPRQYGARVRILDSGDQVVEEIELAAMGWSLHGAGRRLAFTGDAGSGCRRVAIHERSRLDLDCRLERADPVALEVLLGSAPPTRYTLRLEEDAGEPFAAQRGRRR